MDATGMAKKVFSANAQLYQQRFMDVTAFANGLTIFCQALVPKPLVLDVACGPGNLSRFVQDALADGVITGFDVSPEMVALAQANNPQGSFSVMDCRYCSSLSQTYHGVLCGFVLPYLTAGETETLLNDCARLLRPNGVLYLSTMQKHAGGIQLQTNIRGQQLWVHYHQSTFILEVLANAGFKVLFTETVPTPNNEAGVTDWVVVCQKI